ncbi:nucleoside triphosphate pyrophosphohydrolase [Moraxella nasibovis]|uniref:nucleoside triphosphate pyrophosphohydrolase n=1 Tax=Moraxella nasibovis TaxID=2904120 RepID=UPI00240F1879|nr:nucleoside triphosphate pyrophosphohydrolase [Moraxella nasibovis]WFF38584.1 nucleoside triphosphate pyrophosphohydrolase [Moraxella nasibovis]
MTPSRNFDDLMTLMRTLRTECPWDKKQTNLSLLPYLLEESHELIEATHEGDLTEIKGELGDVLLQVVFHAVLYDEQGEFDMGEVIHHLMEKLIRRHPHVFEKETLTTDEAVKQRWQEIKALENQGKPRRLLSDVKAGTALDTAQNLQSAAAKVGFDWQNLGGVLDKLTEELGELKAELPSDDFAYRTDALSDDQKSKIAGELGDVLFVLANLARHLGLDGEMVLQGTNAKFKRRFAFVEESLIKDGKSFADSSLEEMDEYWNQAKDELGK